MSVSDPEPRRAGFWRDREGRVVLMQAPNPPLLGWIVLRVGSLVVSSGRAHDGLSFLASASLFTWAYLELAHGVNGFRRSVGAVVMGAIVVGRFR